jgi:hypothetical protein
LKAILLLVLCAASTMSARAALGAPATAAVALTWDAPESCPGRAHVVLEIERLLGRDLLPSDQPTVRVEAHVREVDGAFVLEITTTRDGETRRRELRDDACQALADSAALIVALAIDPGAGVRAREVVRAEERPAPPSPPPRPPPRDARAKPPSPGVRVRALVGAAAAVDTSTLPTAGAGFTLSAGAAFDALSIEARGSYFPPQRAESNEGTGGDVSLATGGLRLCYEGWRPDRFTLGACAGMDLGAAMATGFGVRSPGSGKALWAAPSLGARGSYRMVGPVDAVASLEALVPLVRDRFVLSSPPGEVHRLPAATGRLELGLRVAFP